MLIAQVLITPNTEVCDQCHNTVYIYTYTYLQLGQDLVVMDESSLLHADQGQLLLRNYAPQPDLRAFSSRACIVRINKFDSFSYGGTGIRKAIEPAACSSIRAS